MSLYWIENPNSLRLAIVARPRGGDWLQDELRRLQNSGIQILVSTLTQSEIKELGLTQEQEECRACGIQYFSFPIEDRSVPEGLLQFKAFVDQVAALVKEGKAVAVHCRAGIGRSSFMACSVLVRIGFRCPQAWLMVQQARGCSVPDTEEQKEFVEILAKAKSPKTALRHALRRIIP
ncbi:MAG TPA: dual specificity protein phosphatase family protein [Candidatus Angelobacter sp.]|jgi:protein-tyrosine phosphatase|nr:dual specificity protein phosphatase family protein [Candidatus Angelobacter sp.]